MKKALALIACFVLALSLIGCGGGGKTTPPSSPSPGEENKTDKEEAPELTPEEQVKAYRAIPEVKAFFNDLPPILTEIMEASFAGDSTTATLKALDVNDICRSFINVKDVPEAVKAAHRKYIDAAFLLWQAAIDIAKEKYAEASENLDKATEIIGEGHELLPAN